MLPPWGHPTGPASTSSEWKRTCCLALKTPGHSSSIAIFLYVHLSKTKDVTSIMKAVSESILPKSVCARSLISRRPCSLIEFFSLPVDTPHVIVKSFTGGEPLTAESANNCVVHALCARPRDHHWSRGVHGRIPFSLFIFRSFSLPFPL